MGSLKNSFVANIEAAGLDPKNEEHMKMIMELGAFMALGASVAKYSFDQMITEDDNDKAMQWANELVQIGADIKEILVMAGRDVACFKGDGDLAEYEELANHTGAVN